MKLNGKTALITGGTTGIGMATAKLLHSEGARVIVTGVNKDRIEAARAELGSEVLVLAADSRNPVELKSVFDTVRERFGTLDILFANAGVGTVASLAAVTEEQIDEQFGINFKGIFLTIQQAAPLMVKGSSVVLTSSFLNEVGAPGFSILSASKAAVRSLARTLGAELAPRGIDWNRSQARRVAPHEPIAELDPRNMLFAADLAFLAKGFQSRGVLSLIEQAIALAKE